MTKLILSDRSVAFYPVIFNVFKNLKHPIKDRETGNILVEAGKPDHRTMIRIELNRCVINNDARYETVGNVIKRLKEMIGYGRDNGNSDWHFSIVSAPESDWERDKRMADPNLVVISQAEYEADLKALSPGNPIISASMKVKVKAVDDEAIGIDVDTGKHKSVKKAPKAAKAA